MYEVRYNTFTKAYHVINLGTGIAQSTWTTQQAASSCARNLNRAYRR